MYLLHGKLTARDGHRNELAAILLEASRLIATAPGVRQYIVGNSAAESNDVYITELWDSKEAHDNSLNAPGVRELIMKAMPLLECTPQKGDEIRVIGGLGL